MFPVQVECRILKFDIILSIRYKPAFQLVISICQISHCSWCRMTAECKSADHYPKNIFLISIPIQSQFQCMIVITKLKSGFCEIITGYVFIVIQEPAFKSQGIAPTENIGVIISKKIDLILSPVKIDTVLRLGN